MDKRFDYSQAAAEADRCLLCHDAPCSKGCPADTDPGKFIRKFKLKNIKGAIRTIKENNSAAHLSWTAPSELAKFRNSWSGTARRFIFKCLIHRNLCLKRWLSLDQDLQD